MGFRLAETVDANEHVGHVVGNDRGQLLVAAQQLHGLGKMLQRRAEAVEAVLQIAEIDMYLQFLGSRTIRGGEDLAGARTRSLVTTGIHVGREQGPQALVCAKAVAGYPVAIKRFQGPAYGFGEFARDIKIAPDQSIPARDLGGRQILQIQQLPVKRMRLTYIRGQKGKEVVL